MFHGSLFLALVLVVTGSALGGELPKEKPSTAEQGPVVETGLARAAQTKPMSQETLLATKFVGGATVELQVDEVTVINIDSRMVPDASHAHVVRAKSPTTDGQMLYVVITREIVARLVQLGIDDLPEHLQGKSLRVTGTVERHADNPPRILIRGRFKTWFAS